MVTDDELWEFLQNELNPMQELADTLQDNQEAIVKLLRKVYELGGKDYQDSVYPKE
jgi:hypothetical protein